MLFRSKGLGTGDAPPPYASHLVLRGEIWRLSVAGQPDMSTQERVALIEALLAPGLDNDTADEVRVVVLGRLFQVLLIIYLAAAPPETHTLAARGPSPVGRGLGDAEGGRGVHKHHPGEVLTGGGVGGPLPPLAPGC